jgi:hypothetical protein
VTLDKGVTRGSLSPADKVPHRSRPILADALGLDRSHDEERVCIYPHKADN